MNERRRILKIDRYVVTALLILAALVIAGCTESIAAPPETDQLNAEVTEFLNRWNAAIANGDERALRDSYIDSKQFRWFEDGALRYDSVDGIVKAIQSFPPGTKVSTTFQDITADRLTPDLAATSAAFKTHIEMPNGDFEFSGVFTAILKRTDTQWRFLRGHTSSLREGGGR